MNLPEPLCYCLDLAQSLYACVQYSKLIVRKLNLFWQLARVADSTSWVTGRSKHGIVLSSMMWATTVSVIKILIALEALRVLTRQGTECNLGAVPVGSLAQQAVYGFSVPRTLA